MADESEWTTICERTNDPKLAYIEAMFEADGIETRRNGESFHAPIMQVRERDLSHAWALLEPIDDAEDDDPTFADGITIRDRARAERAAKKFKIVKPGTDEDVLGGPVGEGNAYVSAYPEPVDGFKHPRDLEVGESSLCNYRLSGSKGTYKVIRIQ